MALSRPTRMGSVPPTGTQTGTDRVPSAVLCLDRHSTAYNRGSCGLGLPLSRLTELTATHHDPSGNHSYLRGPTSQLHLGPGTASNGRARPEGRSEWLPCGLCSADRSADGKLLSAITQALPPSTGI